jgi:D-arabinose 5-phosphate isomerase GutQ
MIAELDSLLTESVKPVENDAKSVPAPRRGGQDFDYIHNEIQDRIDSIASSVKKTAEDSKKQVMKTILVLRDWMLNGTIVRIIGAGRARLAGSIPANRLAHGGARVYIQNDIIPMPHSIKGGGIIAVSASGETPSVLNVLKSVNKKGRQDIKIVGIASKDAKEFQSYCHIFIGIDQDTDLPNPLQALADTGEYVISELLDAMVVAAGKLAGFDETTWRLGHEDIAETGPYDTIPQSSEIRRRQGASNS